MISRRILGVFYYASMFSIDLIGVHYQEDTILSDPTISTSHIPQYHYLTHHT